MKKRILALVLAVAMMVGIVPPNVYVDMAKAEEELYLLTDDDFAEAFSGGFHPKMAYQSALLSADAYDDSNDVLGKHEFKKPERFTHNDVSVICDVKEITIDGQTKRLFSISFRGTNFGGEGFWMNLAADLWGVQTDWKGRGDIHTGFKQCYESFEEGIVNQINSSYNNILSSPDNSDVLFWVTGHSLGGALAEMFVVDIMSDNALPTNKIAGGVSPSNVICYSVGSPPVGSSDLYDFAQSIGVTARIHKIMNNNDIVTTAGLNAVMALTLNLSTILLDPAAFIADLHLGTTFTMASNVYDFDEGKTPLTLLLSLINITELFSVNHAVKTYIAHLKGLINGESDDDDSGGYAGGGNIPEWYDTGRYRGYYSAHSPWKDIPKPIYANSWSFSVSNGEATLSGIRNPQEITKLIIPSRVREWDWVAVYLTEIVYIFEWQPVSDWYPVVGIVGSNWHNETITSVVIPYGVKSIRSAFNDSTLLTNVSIPNSVTDIGVTTFKGCTSLTNITIPDSVTTIGTQAFADSGLREITIPDSVTNLGSGAFRGCTSLESVTLGSGLTSLSAGVFEQSGLTSVSIPDNVTSIDNYAFNNCESLKSVDLGKGVEKLEFYSFHGCTSLTSIVIPDSVTTIANAVFNGCTSLTDVSIPNSVTALGNNRNNVFSDCPIENLYTDMTFVPATETLGSTLKTLTLGDNVKTIGNNAFQGCTSLPSVTIPNSVTHIGSSAFSGCSSLTDVNIPNSVTTIGQSAFSGSGLIEITIPGNVNDMGSGAFASCKSLESLIIEEGAAVANTSFRNCSSLKNVTIGKDVTIFQALTVDKSSLLYQLPVETLSVDMDVFPNLESVKSSLKSVTIGNNVTSIGDRAFSGCTSLPSVTIPESVVAIGNSAFEDCTLLTSINIPNDVTKISDSLFSGCTSLTSIKIPNNVTSIGNSAFKGTLLTNVIIPDSVITIGNSAFGNKELTSVIIGNGVTSIGDNAFSGTSLTNVVIPDSVTTIGNRAFYYCTSLTSATIGDNVTSIGNYTFEGCKNLTEVRFKSEKPPLGSSTFLWVATGAVAIVPPSWGLSNGTVWNRLIIRTDSILPFVTTTPTTIAQLPSTTTTETGTTTSNSDNNPETTTTPTITTTPPVTTTPSTTTRPTVRKGVISKQGIDSGKPTIFCTLEILKALIGMLSQATDNPAALITKESQDKGEPTIFDALEILKYLVGMIDLS